MKRRARRVVIGAAVLIIACALVALFVTRTRELSIVLAAFVLCSLAGALCAWAAANSRQEVSRFCGRASILAILPWLAVMYYWTPAWVQGFEVVFLVAVGLAYGIGACFSLLARLLLKRMRADHE